LPCVLKKIIIDTDIGDDVDDALAIAFAMLRPELDVRAITTVYGPTSMRAQIVAQLLAAGQKQFARNDLPPVAAGESIPLSPLPENELERIRKLVPNQYAFVSGEKASPLRSGDAPPPMLGSAGGCGALALLEEVICENAGQIALVTIGALTNAAQLIRKKPEVARKLKLISIMGGTYLSGKAEHNIRCDPLAAKIVLESDIPKALFSWEVSGKVVLRDLTELRAASGEIPRALCRLIELWWPHRGSRPGPVIYDMSPMLWLFRPELFTMERRGVGVVAEPGPDFGRVEQLKVEQVTAGEPLNASSRTGDRFGKSTDDLLACSPALPCGRAPSSRPCGTVATDMDADAALRLFLDTVCR
jgi:purine nucleosidase/pyrimidine-specific ribonucleoside hydrolase